MLIWDDTSLCLGDAGFNDQEDFVKSVKGTTDAGLTPLPASYTAALLAFLLAHSHSQYLPIVAPLLKKASVRHVYGSLPQFLQLCFR